MATSDQHHFTYSADPCIKHLCQNFIFFDSCCIILIDYITMTETKMELGFLFIFQKTYQANYQPIISYHMILREFLCRSEKKKKKGVVTFWVTLSAQLLSDECSFHQVKKGLDIYSKFYEEYMLLEDLESEPSITHKISETNSSFHGKQHTAAKV